MIAQQPSVALRQPPTDEPISVKRIVAALQVVLATRRAAFSDEHKYWYTLARGMRKPKLAVYHDAECLASRRPDA